MALFADFFMILLFYGLNLLITALMLVCMWHIFIKMGHPGWKGIVPLYNFWVMVKTLKKPIRYFWIPVILSVLFVVGFILFFLLSFMAMQMGGYEYEMASMISISFSLLALFISIFYTLLVYNALAESFGYGVPFTVGLILLPIIFFPILAFGKSRFIEPEDKRKKKPMFTPAFAENDGGQSASVGEEHFQEPINPDQPGEPENENI